MKDRGVKFYWNNKELDGEERSKAAYWFIYGILFGMPIGMGAGLVLCVIWNLLIWGW